jgi:ATP-binding cassette subfamily A (ABC1) protein 3
VTSAPFPVFEVFLARQEAANFLDFSFMVGLAFALIPTVVISFILKEREEQLKHIQLISGMNLSAYWVANMIADIVKAYIPVIITYILAAVFSIKIPGVWAIFLLYPLAIIPTTYCYSFIFKGDTVA